MLKRQINFTGNLERDQNENTTMFLIIKEAKETVLDFPQTVWEYCERRRTTQLLLVPQFIFAFT